MSTLKIAVMIFFWMISAIVSKAQNDSAIKIITTNQLQSFTSKLAKTSALLENGISSKTSTTLRKLIKWENTIKKVLHKISPQLETDLFKDNSSTFQNIQRQFFKDTIQLQANLKGCYNSALDHITTSVKFLQQTDDLNKGSSKLLSLDVKMETLTRTLQRQKLLQDLIEGRKRELQQSLKSLIRSKALLNKISKEFAQYNIGIKNLQHNFLEIDKAQTMVINLIGKSVEYRKFFQNNSQLSKLFNLGNNDGLTIENLQTIKNTGSLISDKLSNVGASELQAIQQRLKAVKSEVNKLRQNLIKTSDSLKVNQPEKSKFRKKFTFTADVQLPKAYLTHKETKIGFGADYQFAEKGFLSLNGYTAMGINLKNKFSITTGDIGVRMGLKWELKWKLFLTGVNEIKLLKQVLQPGHLQKPGFSYYTNYVGLTKQLKVNSKFLKASYVQLLHDLQNKSTQQLIFRIGYQF